MRNEINTIGDHNTINGIYWGPNLSLNLKNNNKINTQRIACQILLETMVKVKLQVT